MAAVSLQLGATAIRDPLTAAIGAIAGILLVVGRVPSVLLVLAGGATGLAAAGPASVLNTGLTVG